MTAFGMMFPGQGSQFLGMLSDFEKNHTETKNFFHQASNILGYDLWALIKYGPIEELNKTWKTQPALLVSSVAIYQSWIKECGKKPKIMLGHSLGEYSALVCSGILDFAQTIKLVELRGKLMQDAIPDGDGAMKVIIGLNKEMLLKICNDVSDKEIVQPVNFNTQNQIVIAGHKRAVERAVTICKSMGAKKIISLPISVPSHCILMKSAAKKFSIALKNINFNTPKIPVVNNVNIKCEILPKNIRKALVTQLYSPIYWTKCINFIISKGINILLEVGPGKILTNITKNISKNLKVISVHDHSSFLKAIEYIR